MKRFILLFIISLLSSHFFAQNHAEKIRSQLLSRSTDNVLVIAHRGDWRNFPENSLEGIENAIQMGVDIVELDVQRTKDGVLILMHDETLNRTTTGKGKVSEATMDYLSNLHLRNGCALRTKHKIPPLDKALLLAKGTIMINLDTAGRYFGEVYSLLKKTGTTAQIIMKGGKSVDEVKKQYGKYLHDIIYMPIVNLDKPDAKQQIEQFCNEINPVAFELLFATDGNTLPQEISSYLKGKSLIWYNTLWDTMAGGHDDDLSLSNPDAGYGHLINQLGARLIQTDRPAYLLDYLRKRNLHH